MSDNDHSPDPTFEEVRDSDDWPCWQDAIKIELAALESNDTWSIVERPQGTNVVRSKWVLHIKCNAEGQIENFKACLLA